MQEFIVSTLEDENDGDFSEGDLSLREAIAIAESGDTITFNSNLGGGTIDLSLGELAINKGLTIRGLGADQLTIGAIGVSRVFNINDGNPDREIDVTLDGLTITNGFLNARSGFFDQGSSFDPRGSGILTTENLDLLNSSVLENETDRDGGGIYSFGGRLRIDNSTIENNRAEGARIRISSTIGGGIATTDTTVEITNSSITGNFAGLDSGGGLDFRNSQVTITDSSIANNTSYGAGGINSINSTVDISRTVITGNETGRSGGSGAINSDADSILNIDRSFIDSNFDFEISDMFRAFASGISARGTTTISNSTISNNTAENLDAGYGIRNTGDLSIVNSTFAGNNDGGINNDGGTVNISNTTIADRLIGADLNNLTSTIVVDDSQELETAIDGNNNLIGNSEDLGLGELQDNGGFTPTVALSENSPAINAGSNLGSLATDQRGEGFDRTVGNGTDIGAFELQTVVDDGGGMIPDELVVSTFEDEEDGDFSEGDLSLREAIAIANSGETITFDSNLSGGTINLSLGELTINKSLTIEGLGANQLTINVDSSSFSLDNLPHRVFNVDDGDDDFLANVSINGLTITGGVVGADRNSSGENGAGIRNQENLTINSSVVTGNRIQVGNGGGIVNEGELTLNNSLVSNNTLGFRGGSGAGIANGGTLNVISSTIANNSTEQRGGGISSFGTLNVINTTIADNRARDGGGIQTTGSATITSSIIAGNSQSDLDGDFTSGGNNLIGNIENPGGIRSGFIDIDSDIVGTRDNPIDPLLGELQDNGGATPTFALPENSPVIDAGSNPNSLANDQRGEGFDRTIGAGTDIGAFELQTINNDDGDSEPPNNEDDGGDGGMIPDELVVSTLEDENDGDFGEGDLSLREAILIANSGEIITFNSNLSGGTINLSSGELAINKSLRIDGLGANSLSISGNDSSRVFLVDDNDANNQINVSIDGLTIRDGEQNGDGSGTSLGIEGGGILNQENLTVTNTLLTNNFAGNGGAIYNRGQLQLGNSLVTNIDSTSPVSNDGGTATISNSTFTNNFAIGTGAIVNFNGATLDLSNSTLANNSGYDFVLSNSEDSTATVTSTIIANNEGSLFPEFSDAGGTFISGGNNLIGNNNGSVGFDDPTDLVGTTDNRLDAMLGQLQDNGGATQTLTLLEDSPAIDAGSNPNNLIFDQRDDGFDRTVGAGTDIGAFELQTVVTPNVNEIIGTAGGDVLEGTESGDRILGLDGNDTIRGLGGDDTIEGNNGNDSIEGGADNDNLDGGAGFDSLFGGEGNDILDAGSGNDSIDGGAGNDFLIGSGDRDTLLGGDGADTLQGGAGVDSLEGGNGNDQLFGGLDNDSLLGGAGNDLIDGGRGNDSLRGDDGDDIFVLASGNGTDTIADFNRGNNLLELSSEINFADLSFSGNDIILGDETLATLNGFDTTGLSESNFTTDITAPEAPENKGDGDDNDGAQLPSNGGGGGTQPLNPLLNGDDVINGDNSDNVLLGGEGNNILYGFEGNDRLETGSGNDTLDANKGDDTLIGGDGNNILFGFDGNDVLETGSGNDTLDAGNGEDIITAGGGNDIITAGSGNDSINAGSGSDTIDGGSDADTIDGGADDDLINGNIGNDTLTGAAGNDTLIGGAGNDFLTGNDGSDLFVLDAQGGTNSIQDFNPSEDTVGLTDDITFSDLTITGSDDAAIAFEGETIGIIANISASDLTADNFDIYEI